MVKTDTLEGIVERGGEGGALFRFHYDLTSDVLYLRLLSDEGVTTIGELTDEGDILLREESTDRMVGMTIVSWWKRFGQGILPDSIYEISRRIEPLASKLAA
ncbi:MAG: DUF2283 domain-containing protein [Phycisphaerales bacterium]|nr:DUF2283 domain-containing protein [Phycisphaerales bacterium]